MTRHWRTLRKRYSMNAEQRAEAVRLRRLGWTYDEIGQRLHFSASGIASVIKQEIPEQTYPARALRIMEAEKLLAEGKTLAWVADYLGFEGTATLRRMVNARRKKRGEATDVHRPKVFEAVTMVQQGASYEEIQEKLRYKNLSSLKATVARHLPGGLIVTGPDRGPWTQTYTGKKFHLADPRPEDIDIHDIAHALSLICRYGGHCRTFYSVAEHSLAVSYIVPGSMALESLLHDAAEAYLGDVPRPLKAMISPAYTWLETKIMTAVNDRFGTHIVDKYWNDTLKWADNTMLHSEMLVLMADPPEPWSAMPPPLDPWQPEYLSPILAEDRFLKRFRDLYVERNGGVDVP